MTPKDVSIRVGDVTLSTANTPKDGIDLNNLSDKSRQALSIFDANGDGKLSKTEIEKAINEFAKSDKTYINKTQENVDNKTNYYDEYTIEEANFPLYRNGINTGKTVHVSPKKCTTKREKGIETRTETVLKDNYVDDDELATSKFAKQVKDVSKLKESAEILQRTMIRELEIKNNGLQETYNENWLKDKDGNHYRYNQQTMKFEKVNNVEYVAKDGSYRTRVKNEKGQQVVRTYADNYKGNIKVLNSENKVYTNPDYAAKVAGLEKIPGGYKASDGSLYVWNNHEYKFKATMVIAEAY